MPAKTYTIELIIENKPAAKDPEGEVIKRDLMNKHGFENVTDVRCGKLLRIKINASSEGEAKDAVVRMCNELRLANPVAHNYSMRVL